MLPTLNYEAILSDPLLILAGVFLVVGPLLFLVSLVKFLMWGRKSKDAMFTDLNPFSPLGEDLRAPEEQPAEPSEPSLVAPPPYMEEEKELPPPTPSPVIPPARSLASEQTVVMPSGVGEIQGQIEIAFSQIKTLSKKVAQMESELESVARNSSARLERNELKEIPMNPADFTQKLLKLAEHVIVLEKEVERLKGAKDSDSSTPEAAPAPGIPPVPSAPKPPVMPL